MIDAHKVWARTRTGVAFNPYQHILSDGQWSFDVGFTEQLMRYCRMELGSNCVLENNSLRIPVSGGMAAMYHFMKDLGPPIAFQTAVAKSVGNLGDALSYAVSVGADAVEIPGNSTGTLSSAEQLQQYAKALEANR